MTAAQEVGEWSAARPGRTLPPGKTRYPFYRRLGEPQVRFERDSPPGFDPGPSSPYSFAIPTELPGPRVTYHTLRNVISRQPVAVVMLCFT